MSHYDEIEIEDMDWNEELNAFTYSCPCGDLFQITMVRHRCVAIHSRLAACIAAQLSAHALTDCAGRDAIGAENLLPVPDCRRN